MSLPRAAIVFVALVLTCNLAFAQVNSAAQAEQQQNRIEQLQRYDLDNRMLANPDIPPGQRALIDYGGYVSPQYYSIDDSNNDNHGLREYQLIGYLRLNFDAANEVFLRGVVQYNDFNAGDSFDGNGSRLINPDFDRAYYKFDLQQYESSRGKAMDGDFVFEGGRDLAYWANGLVLGQTLDGVMPAFTMGPISVATVAGVTPTRTVDFEPDRPEFDVSTRRGFYGAMISAAAGQQHPFVYFVSQRDYNDRNLSIIGPITTRYSYNSNYLGVGSTGAINDHWHYGIEGVYEFGDDLSDSSQIDTSGFAPALVAVPQTRDSISAYAADVKVDYLPQDPNNTRLTLEFILASGDEDRGLTNTTFNGNKPGSIDHAFNGFGLLNTGLAFGSSVSNLLVARVGPSTFPLKDIPAFKRLQLGTDLYAMGKSNLDAPIDQPTNPGVRYLGFEPDVYLNWEVTSDVTFTARYGEFFPNPVAFSSSHPRQFLYIGGTIAF